MIYIFKKIYLNVNKLVILVPFQFSKKKKKKTEKVMGWQEPQCLRKKAASWSGSVAAEACLLCGRWQQAEPAVTELGGIWLYPLGSAQV